MPIPPDVLSQLQQTLQTEDAENLTPEQIVEIINSGLDDQDRFVETDQDALAQNIPDSVYKRFDRDDIVRNRRQIVTQGVWSEGTSKLSQDEMHLSSCQQSEVSGRYFYEVWDSNPDTGQDVEAARIQFYVAYGHKSGSGSLNISSSTPDALEVTKATYAQYRNVLLPQDQSEFEFGDAAEAPDDFYAINVARARYKEVFDPGNWELTLKFEDPNDSGGNNYSTATLVDESAETDFDNELSTTGEVGRELDVVSGSLNLDTTNPPDAIQPDEDLLDGTKTYGKFYPDVGIILLNPKALVEHAEKIYQNGPKREYKTINDSDQWVYEHPTVEDPTPTEALENYIDELIANNTFSDRSSYEVEGMARAESIKPDLGTDSYKFNHAKLFEVINAGGSFIGRSLEEVNSTHFFVRVRNRDHNFSNNPTYKKEDGAMSNPSFFKDPKVYPTTVGLYDDDNTLVAVGKLSKPVQKDFGRELLLEIKLDF